METIESRYGPVAPGTVPGEKGGYLGFSDYGGISGGNDYERAQRTSLMARFAPDTLQRSVRSQFDDPWQSTITPEKPAAVGLVGTDVFGGPSYKTTTRNSVRWFAGEAATSMQPGAPPEGAGTVGWADFAEKPNASGVCGTCNSRFAGSSPITQPPRVGSFGNMTARSQARGHVSVRQWDLPMSYIL
jgi:hypothetical protein